LLFNILIINKRTATASENLVNANIKSLHTLHPNKEREGNIYKPT